MLTPQDVRSVQFEKNLRGYRTEDVDRFLDQIEDQLKQNDAQMEQLRRQIADLNAENQRLHRELEGYEADGDMLKSALINAQRMGENVIREANQKAEDILHRANLRGDDIIRDANELLQKASDRADEIISEATDKKQAEEREYERVRLEVTRFKSDVLNLYRSHVESLSRLPEFQREQPAPAEEKEVSKQPEEAVSAAEPAVEQPVLTEEEAPEEGEDTSQMSSRRLFGPRMRASSSWRSRRKPGRITPPSRVSSSAIDLAKKIRGVCDQWLRINPNTIVP